MSGLIKDLGVLTTIPILLAVGPGIGFLAGGWIDRKVQCYPWFTIIFIGLGFVASGREVARLLKQILKEDSKRKE